MTPHAIRAALSAFLTALLVLAAAAGAATAKSHSSHKRHHHRHAAKHHHHAPGRYALRAKRTTSSSKPAAKPSVSITSAPAASTSSTDATIGFSTKSATSIECQLDGGAWSACSSPSTYSGLSVGAHSFTVRATNSAGSASASAGWSVVAPNTTAPDTTAPSAPTNVAANASDGSVALSWSAASDDVGVAGYLVYRDGARVADVAATSYTDAGLSNGTSYTYTVAAYDAAGNVSPVSNPASATPVAAPLAAPNRIYWGSLIGSQFTGSQPPWSWPAVTAFQNADAGGKGISILHYGGPWYSSQYCSGYCAFPSSVMTATRNAGVIPFYSWSSRGDSGMTGYSDAQIAGGSQDAYIASWAQAAKSWGHPLFVRFDWEMNGNWFPWGVGANGNTAADYVAMWRHVHDVFQSVGATNVSWVWCPNIDPSNHLASMTSLYPGDAYVDWTCLDGYNGNTPWTSFHNLYLSSYNAITASIAPSKPMIVGETGSTESGGSKAQWITDMLTDLPVSFPKIRGLIWYDRGDKGPGGYTDWPIESSSASQTAFANGIASSTYTSNSYAGLSASGAIPPPA